MQLHGQYQQSCEKEVRKAEEERRHQHMQPQDVELRGFNSELWALIGTVERFNLTLRGETPHLKRIQWIH